MAASATVHSAEPLISVRDANAEYRGKIVGLTRTQCTLMDTQGRILELPVHSLKGMKKTKKFFRPDSISDFRSSLGSEFGKSYEVTGTTHYIVSAPRGRAKSYARLFEQIYRDVEQFYRVRKFKVSKPDVPLVAVVFSTREEFVEYCAKDKVPAGNGLQGYYSLLTNRVALYDQSGILQTATDHSNDLNHAVGLSGVAGETANTIVHEGIHQVSYNIGVHSRTGTTPVWIVEGMATVLEPDAMRQQRSSHPPDARRNSERFNWFQNNHGPSRPPGTLAKLVASDDLFKRQTLNAYSEAWALTFFLLENPVRRRQLSAYLQTLVKRDRDHSYSTEQRLADFQQEFGDIARLEIEFLRYTDRL